MRFASAEQRRVAGDCDGGVDQQCHVKSADTEDTEDTEEYLYMEMEHRIGLRRHGKFTYVLNIVSLLFFPLCPPCPLCQGFSRASLPGY